MSERRRDTVRTLAWLEWTPAVRDNGQATRGGFAAEELALECGATGSCWRRSVMEMMLKEEDSNNCVKKKNGERKSCRQERGC